MSQVILDLSQVQCVKFMKSTTQKTAKTLPKRIKKEWFCKCNRKGEILSTIKAKS